MTHRRAWVRSSLAALSFLSPWVPVGVARAETQCGDTTCPKNWECQSETGVAPTPACAPNTDCPTPEPTTYERCSPLPCTSDADCASDMVCYTETTTLCADPPPCAKGADCVAPADGACEPETHSACVPRYVPPCETDSDCGTGFTCELEQSGCGCASAGSAGSSGSAGSATPGNTPSDGSGAKPAPDGGAGDGFAPPPADGGADPAPPADGGAAPAPVPSDGGAPPPDCSCPASTVKACKLKVTACEAASDCPAGFTCEDNPADCWASSDGSSGCNTPDPAKICAPPYTELVGGVGSHGSAEDSSGTATGGDTQAGEPPKGAPADPGETNNGAPRDIDPGEAHDSSGSGCSVQPARGQTGESLALFGLALVGLSALRRRRA